MITLLPEEAREMPETRPDDQVLEHKWLCKCAVCSRPEAEYWRRVKRRRAGLNP